MPFVKNQNFRIKQITLKNETAGTSVDLISDKANAYHAFDMLTINEDMNEPSLSGSIIVVDNNNFVDSVNLKGGSSVIIFTLTFNDPDTTVTKKRGFSILDCKVLNDMADQKVSGGSGTPNKLLIRFASRSYVYTNFGAAFSEDFIGTISNPHEEQLDPFTIEQTPAPVAECKKITNKIIVPGTSTTVDKDVYVVDSVWGVDKPKSFISKIVSFFNADRINDTDPKPLNSDSSYNDVWIKPLNYYYPKFKNTKNALITNLLNYVKENTILIDGNRDLVDNMYHPKRPMVDFMFWEDLDSFNFRSISNLAQKYNNKEILYYFDMDENDMGTISSMEVIKDVETVSLFMDGVYASEYIYVKPNWGSPYRDSGNAAEEFKKSLVRYNYTTDIWKSNYNKIKELPVIARSFTDKTKGYSIFNRVDMGIIETPNAFDTRSFSIADNNFGYYDTNTHGGIHDVKWWDFLGDFNFGFTYNNYFDNNQTEKATIRKPPAEGAVVGTTLSYKFHTHTGRYDTEFWQAQYDFSELPGSALWLINNKIKWNPDLVKDRQEYYRLKTLKEKWNFYKEKICCERKVPTSFFALITDAKKVYGGPSQEVFDTAPKEFKEDNGGFYAYDWVEVEFWPRSDVTSVMQNGEEIIKMADRGMYPFVFVKPRGALQGTGIRERTYKPAQRNTTDPAYKPQPNNGGVTGLNRSANVGKKYYSKDTRAYNINEILNTAGLTLNAQDRTKAEFQVLVNTAEKCKSIISNPGVTSKFVDKNSTVAGPCDAYSSYPKDFSMMPVGHFRVLSPCGTKYIWKFGRIVQMYAIPKEMMYTFSKFQDQIPDKGISFSSDIPRSPYGTKQKTKTETINGTRVVLDERDKIVTDLSYTDQDSPEYKKYGVNKLINQSPYLFLFDVENAHDGLCDGTC